MLDWVKRLFYGPLPLPAPCPETIRVSDPDDAREKIAWLVIERGVPIRGEVDWDEDGGGGTMTIEAAEDGA